MGEPYGRRHAVALVREFMTRPEPQGRPTTRRVPILVFTGPKGCGRTALLDALSAELKHRTPHARIDCAGLRSTAAWEVLSYLTFEFNRTAAEYRRIPFPRFVTAQVAIAEPLSLHDVQGDRARIREALERLRRVDRLREFVAGQAEAVTRAVPGLGVAPGVADAARLAPGLVLRGLISWRRGRRVVLGRGLEWYGDGDHAYDELIRLNRLTRDDAGEADRREAAELLWAAFLADLRAAFDQGRGARRWSLNCVVLLDDVDTRAGRLLHRALVDARRREPDPLTVVATSAGGVAQHVAPDQEIPFAEKASYADYVTRGQGGHESDSYPVALRDLTLDEVATMVARVGGPWLSARRDVAASVYRFTLGHPAATAVLVEAIGGSTRGPVPLRTLLGSRWRGPVDEEPVTVGERMLRQFLGTPPDDVLATLEVCAAARDVEQAEELTRSGLIPRARGDAAVVPADLRVNDPATGRAVMLPALRNLLLHRLAATPDRWSAAHTWLRDNGRESDRRYHALAARDVMPVVGWLEERVADPEAWFAELHLVTSAPRHLDPDEADPDRVLDAVGWTGPPEGPSRTIAGIVAALWTANDPLSSADRADLFSSAAWDLRALAQAPRAARTEFRRVAEEMDARAETGDETPAVRPVRLPAGPLSREPVDFTPPVPRLARRRARLQAVALVAVVALVAGVVAAVVWDRITRCGEGVHRHGDECVGVTDGSYAFDERLADVQRKILAENERVTALPHVTLAVLTPLVPTEVGSVTWQRVRSQLEGAHVAQLAANAGERSPKIRLLLANPGSAQQEWSRVVGQLADLVDSDRLVGVVGVGQSTVRAQETARALSAHDLPMVASVVTATNFNVEQPAPPGGQPTRIRGFARVSSTTGDQIAVLSQYLAETGVGEAMLVHDVDEDDLYTATLYDEFKAAASGGKLSITVESRFDTEASLDTQFREIMRDLCGDGAPDTVLYAGRAVLLDDLIGNLQRRGCALDRRITLVTGSDASMLRTRPDLRPREDQPDLAIVYTPHVDPDAARQEGNTVLGELTAEFERLGFDPTDLLDGWGVMMHDATLAASEAISRAGNGLAAGELPSRQAVRAELERSDRERNQVRGAGGTFTLDAETGDAVGRRLPVVEVGPTGEFTVRAVRDVPRR
jgi:hypothetical protein